MSESRSDDAAALPRHGGGVAAAARRFGLPADGWLDLSTGINPRPWPVPPLPQAAWSRLPDSDAAQALREAAAAYLGVAMPEAVVPAPGAQALIQLLPRLLRPRRVAVLGPTYAEHEAGWRAAGHRVVTVAALAEAEAEGAEAVVVVNPNNPDGRVLAPGALLAAADALAARGGLLLVDEAFADAVPAASVAAQAPRPGLVVLRSFGKFFGLAGVRLGLAVAEPDLARRLAEALGPWATSGPALHIGAAAYADAGWIAVTRAWLDTQARALDALLRGAGWEVVGGTPLFRLLSVPDGWALYERLAMRRVLVRPFAHDRRLVRLGLPRDVAEMQQLQAVLASQ